MYRRKRGPAERGSESLTSRAQKVRPRPVPQPGPGKTPPRRARLWTVSCVQARPLTLRCRTRSATRLRAEVSPAFDAARSGQCGGAVRARLRRGGPGLPVAPRNQGPIDCMSLLAAPAPRNHSPTNHLVCKRCLYVVVAIHVRVAIHLRCLRPQQTPTNGDVSCAPRAAALRRACTTSA